MRAPRCSQNVESRKSASPLCSGEVGRRDFRHGCVAKIVQGRRGTAALGSYPEPTIKPRAMTRLLKIPGMKNPKLRSLSVVTRFSQTPEREPRHDTSPNQMGEAFPVRAKRTKKTGVDGAVSSLPNLLTVRSAHLFEDPSDFAVAPPRGRCAAASPASRLT